ncbi:MAG: hypothetical protein JO250_05555 [Armatimonadetes bacterium]|nr:hypothetical protein [Armatimonadota bacterium]
MTRTWTSLLVLALMTLLWAQSPAAPSLQVTASERQFFQLGDTLGRAAFAYADLEKRANLIHTDRSNPTQLEQLAGLAPVAARNRMDARDGFARALALMQALAAPDAALAPVRRAAAHLAKPLSFSGDAKRIAAFSRRAAQTLASLDEFNQISSVPEAVPIRHWLASPGTAPAGRVWYAEGLIAALAETADAQRMPELLPPVKEIATDLRGLRDWLSLRLPESPTPDQTALETALNDFLRQTSRTGRPQATPLTLPQLQALGDISRRLQTQILGDAAPPAPEKTSAGRGASMDTPTCP